MSSSNSIPEFKGYRIRQQTSTEQIQPPAQTLIKVIVKNQTNGIPKIRHDVICNGKHYPFIPLFNFTSEDDLGILEQISTIVLRDQNQILCEILSKRVTEIPVSQFQELKTRLQAIFALELKVDPEQLFLLLVSQQFNDQAEFNSMFDSISQTQFVSLMKRVYENCPNKLIPKILRRITKYLNSTKARSESSVLKFKKLLKIMKSTDQSIDSQQQIESPKKVPEPPKKVQPKVQEKPAVSSKEQLQQKKIEEVKKQQPSQKKVQTKVSVQEKSLPQKPILTISKEEVQAAKKQSQAKRKEKKAKKNEEKIAAQKLLQTPQQNSSDWHDVNSNDEDEDITNSINKMAFHADESDDDFKYQGPKKKNKKKNNAAIQLDPEFDASAGRKNEKLQKQNKKSSSPSNATDNIKDAYQKGSIDSQQNAEDKIVVEKPADDRKVKNRQYNNRRNASESKTSENGFKQFTRQKKIDPRILFGINGAPDAVWRQRMRPQKYPKPENGNQLIRSKQNRNSRIIKATPMQEKTPKQEKQKELKQSKNLTLQKVFSLPDDSKDGKDFKFQKRNYNLFVNKLFWVNIHQGQVTIQKDGKGYIRKCPIEIIDNGKGIMAEGLTINIDGLSNLQDGGTAFGDPVFEEFTPQGQWFLITSLDVFAYV